MEPWPLAMTEPNRLRYSFTMTPESKPFGALTAVTEELGEPGENNSRPNVVTAARVALASISALATSLSMPRALTYFKASARARSSDVAGVQLDSPFAAFFFSFFRLK